jgi:hypothetical protein
MVFQYLAILVMSAIGLLIIRYHPCHAIGWLLISVSFLLVLDLFAFSYAAYGLHSTSAILPVVALIAQIGDDFVFFVQFGLILVLLLFLNGKFLSTGWRIFAWCMGGLMFYGTVIWMIAPGPIHELPSSNNPIGTSHPIYQVFSLPARFISQFLVSGSVIAGLIALLQRYRQADQETRMQIKWFTFGITPFILGSIIQ